MMLTRQARLCSRAARVIPPLTAFSTLMFRDRLLTRAVQYRDRKGAAEQASRKCIRHPLFLHTVIDISSLSIVKIPALLIFMPLQTFSVNR
jgi:hypothetical protein